MKRRPSPASCTCWKRASRCGISGRKEQRRMSTGVVVTHAYRTAVGRSGRGTLRHTRPDELLAQLMKAFMERVPEVDPAAIDDVVIGCAFPEAEQGMNVARLAVLRAGLPITVPAVTMNRFCSSGLQALATGAGEIVAGWSDIVLTGGVESMTMVPMGGGKPAPNPWLADNLPSAYEGDGHHQRERGHPLRRQPCRPGCLRPRVEQQGPGRHQGGPVQGRDHPHHHQVGRQGDRLRHRRRPQGEHPGRPGQVAPRLQGGRRRPQPATPHRPPTGRLWSC